MPRPRPTEPTILNAFKAPAALKAEFARACRRQGTTASAVLRQAMRDFVRPPVALK